MLQVVTLSRRVALLFILATIMTLSFATRLVASCSFTTMPSPNGTHNAIALTDPSGQQVAYFDLYWGGVLGSLQQSGTERLWGNHPIGMVQPRLFYYPAGPPPAQPYELAPAGNVNGLGRPPLGALCVDQNTVSTMNGLTDYAAGTSGYKVLSGVVDGSIVPGMYVAPYFYNVTASFVPNPNANPPGAPSYYLRLQQRVTNTSDAEAFAFSLWLRNAVPNAYTFTAQSQSPATPVCTASTPCTSSSTRYLVAGRYPTAALTGGIAFAVSPSSIWNVGTSTSSVLFDTDTANSNQRATFINTYWSLAPGTSPTSTGVSRTMDLYVLAGDWASAASFASKPHVSGFPSPASGPIAGGTMISIDGAQFMSGATVSVGGTAATGVTVVNPGRVTATLPAHAAGAADVKVTNTDGSFGTLVSGFVYDFSDVTVGSSQYSAVTIIARDGITAGCGGNSFCPTTAVTRAQMAVFLLRAEHGATYVPPACTGAGIFADVPCPSGFAVNYIEQLYRENVTAGCSTNPLDYCPNDSITRAQMAVYLAKARWGPSYVPPVAARCTFLDVTTPGSFADFIEVVNYAGAMGTPVSSFCVPGCNSMGVNISTCSFKPTDAVTRGSMAVFLVSMFNLQ